jgi:hypothetical protein
MGRILDEENRKHPNMAMSHAAQWAVKIAEETSPNEVELAPLWAEAFVEGGRSRRELFARTNAQASAFTAGDFMPTLPLILKGLAVASPVLLSVLTSDLVGKALECVKNALAVGELLGKGRGWFSTDETKEATAGRADLRTVYAQLNHIMERLDQELRPLNLDQVARDRVGLVVLRLLLDNPPDATLFVGEVARDK